jgi:hypothetical protein
MYTLFTHQYKGAVFIYFWGPLYILVTMGVNLTEGDNIYFAVVLIFIIKCHVSVRMTDKCS